MQQILIALMTLSLAACASQSVQPSDEEIFDARADQAPALIYDTSFSHGGTPQEVTGLTVGLMNVSDKEIGSVTLLITFCMGATGQDVGGYSRLPIQGPFEPNTSYETNPTLGGSPQWTARRTAQMIIKGVEVMYSDGTERSYSDKSLSKVLGKHLSNYCSTTLYPNKVPGQFGG